MQFLETFSCEVYRDFIQNSLINLQMRLSPPILPIHTLLPIYVKFFPYDDKRRSQKSNYKWTKVLFRLFVFIRAIFIDTLFLFSPVE